MPLYIEQDANSRILYANTYCEVEVNSETRIAVIEQQ
jgi:hypothetical protein